jgi:multiple sugar transport system permease protein
MARKIFIYAAAVVVFLFCAGPLILTALGGVIPESALLSSPSRWFSEAPSLENYKYIFFGTLPTSSTRSGTNRAMISEEARQIPRAMLNSALIAVSVMAVNILFASMSAYAFARLNFRGKQATFMAIVMCRLIPAAALVVPFYLIVQAAGLLDTMLAIIPVEIEESARVDGASPVQIFRKITLPLSASSIVATGLFAFMLSYSEFLYAMVLGGTVKTRTISVVMAALSTNPDMAWGLLMAGVFLTLIPTLILVIIVWKFVVENIILGASKY